VRFSIDRRWAIPAVAVLGAGGGSLLGFVTAVSSTTTRPRPRVLPAATADLTPATTSTT
jgi:hypothetical protein